MKCSIALLHMPKGDIDQTWHLAVWQTHHDLNARCFDVKTNANECKACITHIEAFGLFRLHQQEHRKLFCILLLMATHNS